MAPVSAILSAEQGPYEWGRRDCLTTARALIAGLCGECVDLTAWHGLTEARAMACAVREHGSIAAARATTIASLERVWVAAPPLEPGDIVELEGWVEVGAGRRESCGGELMGFVGDECAIWHWTPTGLLPVSNAVGVARVYRCRR